MTAEYVAKYFDICSIPTGVWALTGSSTSNLLLKSWRHASVKAMEGSPLPAVASSAQLGDGISFRGREQNSIVLAHHWCDMEQREGFRSASIAENGDCLFACLAFWLSVAKGVSVDPLCIRVMAASMIDNDNLAFLKETLAAEELDAQNVQLANEISQCSGPACLAEIVCRRGTLWGGDSLLRLALASISRQLGVVVAAAVIKKNGGLKPVTVVLPYTKGNEPEADYFVMLLYAQDTHYEIIAKESRAGEPTPLVAFSREDKTFHAALNGHGVPLD